MRANTRKDNGDHAGNDFAVSVGETQGSGFGRMPSTVTSLICINMAFLNKNKSGDKEIDLIIT